MADRSPRLFASPEAPHRVHDLLLVAAYAAGDVTDAERTAVEALVAACPECAAVVADVRSIGRALAALPAERRPRDFRLTPADAERLRPHTLRGRFRILARPRLERAYPVATGLTALGLTGLLFASLSLAPLAGTPVGGNQRATDSSAAPLQVEMAPGATAPSDVGMAGEQPAATLEPAVEADEARDANQATTGDLAWPYLVIGGLSVLATLAGVGLFLAARGQRRSWR